jgi:hypothetical protein
MGATDDGADPDAEAKEADAVSKWKACSVAGCLRQAKARGLCQPHLDRLRHMGSVQADRPVLMMNHKGTRGALAQKLRRNGN